MNLLPAEPDEKKMKRDVKRDDSKCISCGKYFRKGLSKARTIRTREEAENFYKSYDFYVGVGDELCDKCFSKLRVKTSRRTSSEKNENPDLASSFVDVSEQAATSSVVSEDVTQCLSQSLSQISLEHSEFSTELSASLSESSNEDSLHYSFKEDECKEIEIIEMPFPRVVSTKAYCIICKSKDDIHDVPKEARIQAFVKRRIFIPRRSRCCYKHLIKNRFYEDEVQALVPFEHKSFIEASEIKDFVNHLANEVDSRLHDQIGNCQISEERVKAFTGHDWNSIIKIRNMMCTMRDSENRNVIQALVMFLFKLRSGNSNKLIAAIMEVNEHIVDDSIHAVVKCFREHVLPKYFGVGSRSREDFLQEASEAATLRWNIFTASEEHK